MRAAAPASRCVPVSHAAHRSHRLSAGAGRGDDVSCRATGLRIAMLNLCPECGSFFEPTEPEGTKPTCPHCGTLAVPTDDETFTYQPADQGVLGHFRLQFPVGHGTYGLVWKAYDTKLDR